MLIRITERCRMGCSHCMVDARPDGRHMSVKTYRAALRFAARMDGMAILTGGEPTEHPRILDFVRQAQKQLDGVVIASNGMFLDTPLKDPLLRTGVGIQITNDDRYYPKRVPVIEHPRLFYEDRIRTLSPLGRSKKMEGRSAPGCFNIRSATLALHSLSKAISTLRQREIFCTPSIDVDGQLRAGESTECYTFGTVHDSDRSLVLQLEKHDCDRCDLHRLLNAVQLAALWDPKIKIFR